MLRVETSRLEIPKELEKFQKPVQFLQSKARKSRGTAKTYGTVLTRLARFIEATYPNYNIETILTPLLKKEDDGDGEKIDVYRFLDALISFYDGKIKSLDLTVNGVKSYLQYWDIEITKQKFKNKVTMPLERKEDERPLEKSEIRMILTNADDLRFRAYLFFLAASGCRAVEGLMVRVRDIDFTASPAKVYMRAEFSKNKMPREVYLTDEAAAYVQKWLAKCNRTDPNELVFSISTVKPAGLYHYANEQFNALLKRIGLDQIKTDGVASNYRRHEVTLHSFRRHAQTVIEDCTSLSFSDYILGHKKSSYYVKKEPERRALYLDKCVKALTFLDYQKLDMHAKTLEGKMEKSAEVINMIQNEMAKLRKRSEADHSTIDDLVSMIKHLRETHPDVDLEFRKAETDKQ